MSRRISFPSDRAKGPDPGDWTESWWDRNRQEAGQRLLYGGQLVLKGKPWSVSLAEMQA